jgi:hypothetical protein
MANSITLNVGETTALKSFKDHIAYAGMPSENVYSIVQMKNVGNKDALAWNLFFPKSKTEIIIDKVNILVENVTTDVIQLRMGTWQ